ncbi:MAG: recombinase family protein [Alphaproteobacteria bacterium]|nr:recombinase family protein [Alphaproteobacteria bacterium]
MTEQKKRIRCAIYTRKSTEEGLDMEFNSLDAQREAGESYINAQRHEGWTLVPEYYDDGGFSGGSMDRPALKKLIRDIENGLIDVVVVYKVDRLSRALSDFAKLIDLFDKHNVSFVSVTQQFNTTTSMGRLTLNILLSFAQFEREVIGERIRDKIAATKRKGMWIGGIKPLGYDTKEKKLVIDEKEAQLVRMIFERFVMLKSMTLLAKELRDQGYRTKSWVSKNGKQRGGRPITKGFLYKALYNRTYLGEINHKGNTYPGQHQPIIDFALWEKVHSTLKESPRKRAVRTRGLSTALLQGLAVCGGCQSVLTPTHSKKPNGRLYRYYKASAHLKNEIEDCPIGAVPAGELENIVLNQMRLALCTPEMMVRVWREAIKDDHKISEQDVRSSLQNLNLVWDELFPTEQARLLKLLIDKIIVNNDRIDIRIHAEGLNSLVRDIQYVQQHKEAA